MKKILFFLLSLALCEGLKTEALDFTARSFPTNQTFLPLKFDTGNKAPNGLPSTIIYIEGKAISLLFDTGANKSELTLSRRALKGLNVKFTGKQICFKSFDGKHCEKEFIIPKVKLGNFELKNVKGTLMPKLWGGGGDNFMPTKASDNGVIGYNLLSKFNLLLDYPHAKVFLYKRGKRIAQFNFTRWINIPFTEQLHTNVSVNGKKMVLQWDTGSVPSVIKATSVKNMQTAKCRTNMSFGKDKNCRRLIVNNFYTAKGIKLPTTWLLIRDIPSFAPFDGLIGSNFYRKNLVYFDFDHNEIYVKSINIK